MDVGGWLRGLGLEQYEAAFRDNRIDDTVLPRLTAEDLKMPSGRCANNRSRPVFLICPIRKIHSLPSWEESTVDVTGLVLGFWRESAHG
jgi:hypothetical protein